MARRVTIAYRSRNPDDALRLLQAVEEALQPQEIIVSPEGVSESFDVADEQLETRAREKAAEVLDAEDRRRSEPQQQADDSPVQIDVGTTTPMTDFANRKTTADGWVRAKLNAGWQFLVKVLPVAKMLKDLAG